MKQPVKTFLQLLAGLLLAALLLWLTFRGRSVADLVADMRQADPFWMALSAMGLLASFVFRALRWQILLHSSGYPTRTYPTILSMTLCYLVNSVTPKLGEVARCTALYRTDKVPVPSSLGTVFTERVVDVIVLLGAIGVIFLVEYQRLQDLLARMLDQLGGDKLPSFWLLGLLALIGLLTAWLGWRWLQRRSEAGHGLAGKVYGFLHTMLAGARSIFKLSRPGLFLLYTCLIWVVLIFMNYCFLKALPETQDLGWYMASLILFIGGLGWALPVPGGMGTTHYIVLQLFLAFGLNEMAGQNIALLSNGATFVFTILFGFVAYGLFALLLVQQKQQGTESEPDP